MGPGAEAVDLQNPDEGAPNEGAPKAMANEQCVPLSALATSDDGAELTKPEVDDEVEYQVKGKVSRIDGEMAYVKPMSVNGEEVEAEKQPAAEASGADDYASLEDMARKQGEL